MIGFLRGKIEEFGEKFVILNVNGVGYKVFVSPETLSKIKQMAGDVNPSTKLGIDGEPSRTVKVHTKLISTDSGLDLYGFLSREELEFFDMIDSVAGVGPKGALGILGVAPVGELKSSIAKGNVELLTKVGGIGKKTAERIILELKSRIKEGGAGEGFQESDGEIIDALTSMGYTLREAREAVRKVPPEIQGTETRLKEALRKLGRR